MAAERQETTASGGILSRSSMARQSIVRVLSREALFQNLRYSFRKLFKRPGVTTIVALTLALGFGLSTQSASAIFAMTCDYLTLKFTSSVSITVTGLPSL